MDSELRICGNVYHIECETSPKAGNTPETPYIRIVEYQASSAASSIQSISWPAQVSDQQVQLSVQDTDEQNAQEKTVIAGNLIVSDPVPYSFHEARQWKVSELPADSVFTPYPDNWPGSEEFNKPLVEMTIPNSAYLYLDKDYEESEKGWVKLKYPTDRAAYYPIEIMRIRDFTVESLIEAGLFILLPFTIFQFDRQELKKFNREQNNSDIDKLYTSVLQGIKKSKSNPNYNLSDSIEYSLIEAVNTVFMERVKNLPYTRECLEQMIMSYPVNSTYNSPYLKILSENLDLKDTIKASEEKAAASEAKAAASEAKAAKTQNRFDGSLKVLFSMQAPLGDILKATGLTKKELKEAAKAHNVKINSACTRYL